MRDLRVVFLLIMALAFAACGGGGEAFVPPPGGDGVSKTIGPAGGTVTDPGGASIQIPAGALDQNTTITIYAHKNIDTLPAPVPFVAGASFGPDGLIFNVPVMITLILPETSIPGTEISLFTYDGHHEAWTPSGFSLVVDNSGKEASGEVVHFTSYIIVGFKVVEKDEERYFGPLNEAFFNVCDLTPAYTIFENYLDYWTTSLFPLEKKWLTDFSVHYPFLDYGCYKTSGITMVLSTVRFIPNMSDPSNTWIKVDERQYEEIVGETGHVGLAFINAQERTISKTDSNNICGEEYKLQYTVDINVHLKRIAPLMTFHIEQDTMCKDDSTLVSSTLMCGDEPMVGQTVQFEDTGVGVFEDGLGVTDSNGYAEDTFIAEDMGKSRVTAIFEWWKAGGGTLINSENIKVHDVARVEVSLEGADLCVGEALPLEAKLYDMDGVQHTCYDVNWSSSNQNAAVAAPPTGYGTSVAAVGEGTATITAESEGVTNDVEIDVGETCLAVTPAEACIAPDGSIKLNVVAEGSIDLSKVIWTSSNTNVAVVDTTSGLVQATGEGQAVITATHEDRSGEAAIYTRDHCIEVAPTQPCLIVGETIQLELTSPLNLASYDINWRSLDENIAKIHADLGYINGVAGGTADIEVTADDGITQYVEIVTVNVPSFPDDYRHASLADINSGGGISPPAAFLTDNREVIPYSDLLQEIATAGTACGRIDIADMTILDVNSSGTVVGVKVQDEVSVIFNPDTCLTRYISRFAATGINDDGVVVGSAAVTTLDRCPYNPGTYGKSVGIIYDNGNYEEVDLESLVPNIAPDLYRYFHTSFIDINDNGLILGVFWEHYQFPKCIERPNEPPLCSCVRKGGFWPTNVFGNRRTVYFVYDRPSGYFHEIEYPDFGDPGVSDDDTLAQALNDGGDVVGFWQDGRVGFVHGREGGWYTPPYEFYGEHMPIFYDINISRDILGAYRNTPPTPNDFLLHLCPIPLETDACNWINPADHDHIAGYEPDELTCDGFDNDCNGLVDDIYPVPLNSRQTGICEGSEQICSGADGWMDDYSYIPEYEIIESTCDNLDNDCDGIKDEGCPTMVIATVVDSRGNPVPFAEVIITSDPVYTSTNASGRFMAFVEIGDHSITVTKDGQTVYSGNFSAPSITPVDLGTLRPEDGGATYLPWYHDSDGDGYGDPDVVITDATPPPQYVETGSDCNDSLAAVNPGATEVCNNTDDDCDGTPDEDLPTFTYYADADSDGYGIPSNAIQSCLISPPSGHAANSTDCDDTQVSINPGAAEACNSTDDDCDSLVDEDISGEPLTRPCYSGPPATEGVGQCSSGSEVCTTGAWGSCMGEVLPFDETCDELDNNCDGSTDEGFPVFTYYQDSDFDGFGDPSVSYQTCLDPPPEGYAADNTDCDDALATVNPGMTEVCSDGIDQDCSGQDLICDLDFDDDGDGYSENQGDCDDANFDIYPGAPERCDTIDNDCDTFTDEEITFYTLFADADEDGFGTAAATTQWCAPLAVYSPFDGDCDDTSNDYYPGAPEWCNDALDQDCDGSDISCPPISLQASTISPVLLGSWWDYWVTGDDTGWLYRYVYVGYAESPQTGQDTIDMEDEFDLEGQWALIDRYLFQDPDGTVRQAGLWWEDDPYPNWVTSASGDGGNFVLYPSPLAAGQSGSTTFSYDTPGSVASYSYSVHDAEIVGTYAGSIEAYRITTLYEESWPAEGFTPTEEYTEDSTVWFHPDIGEVKRDFSFEDRYGGELWTEASLTWTLDDSHYFEPMDCGGLGSGSGSLAALAGTWTGTGTDNPGLIDLYKEYTVSIVIDDSGNIQRIRLNGLDQKVILPVGERLTTGTLTPLDDNLYSVQFRDFDVPDDTHTGLLIVDDTFTYMHFMADTGFDDFGKVMFFSVLQKGSTGQPGYSREAAIDRWTGIGYDYCTIGDNYYRFEPTGSAVFPLGPVVPYLPVQGTGPDGNYNQNMFAWSNTFAYGGAADPAGKDTMRMFLSPDGEFMGAYRFIRATEWVWWDGAAFYLLRRE